MKHFMQGLALLLLLFPLCSPGQINPTTRLRPTLFPNQIILTKLAPDGKYRYYPTSIIDAELQQLTWEEASKTLSITGANGNAIVLTGLGTQQLQTPLVNGQVVTIVLENGGTASFTVADQDNDSTNELDALTVSSTAPSSPGQGDVWVDTGTNSTKKFDGSSWVVIGVTSSTGGSDNLGNHTASQELNLSGFRATKMASPVSSQDGANKAYVDNHTDGDSNPTNELQSWSTLPGIPSDWTGTFDGQEGSFY